MNFVAAPTIVAGNYVVTFQGSAGSATAQANLNVSITGSTSLSLSMGTAFGYAGQGATLNVLTSSPSGYKGPLWLTFNNLPAGIAVSGQPLALVPGAQQIGLSFDSSTVPGNYTLSATLTGGGQSTNATSGAVTVSAPTGIQASANNVDIVPGGTATVSIFCLNNSGSNCLLQGTISALPAGLTVSPNPPWQITSQGVALTFTAASPLPTGVYPVTITATSGGHASTLTLNFYVNNANFTLAVPAQSQLSVHQGESSSLSLDVVLNTLPGGVANFAVDMSVSGLPQGTVAYFSPSHVVPGSGTTLTVAASANAPITYRQGLLITATPTNSVLPESVPISLSIVPPAGQLPASRSDFLNVNGSKLSGVFDPIHNQVFVGNPDYNRVDVVSLANRSVIASIPVPEPASLTRSLDGTQIIIGTQTSQVVWIDTSLLQIAKTFRVPANPTNPPSQPPVAQYVHELADGTLLVMPSLMIVNPSNSQVITLTPPGVGVFDVFTVNDQGTKIVLAQNGTMLSVYDVASATFASTSYTQPVSVLGIDPAGHHILAGARVFDMFDGALSHLGAINIGQSIVQSVAFVFSPDGTTAYLDIAVDSAGPTIYTVDVSSLTLTGLAPALGGTPFAADQTGLLIGTAQFGITVDDANFQISSPANAFNIGHLIPSVGPVGQQTQTQLGSGGLFLQPDVYFGTQHAAAESIQTTAPFTATATAPASSVPGPVDVKLVWPNGAEGFLPFGFTYGPFIKEMLTDGSNPDGGSAGSLLAFGVPSDPSQIQLTIGGVPANVTAAIPLNTGSPPAYPFPITKVSFTAPPGRAGSADIALTTSNGTSSLKDVFHYASSQEFAPPVSGTTYHALLYNPKRNEVYLNGGDHVDVFSTSTSAFVGSISSAALTEKVLTGMAVSTDGNTLYIADMSDGLLVRANLANLSSGLASIPVAPASQTAGCLTGPVSVAVTSDSKAYVAYYVVNGCTNLATPAYYRVDLQTSAVTTFSFVSSNCRGNFAASSNGNELVMSPISGPDLFCIYDVNSGQIHVLDSNSNLNLSGSAKGLAISGDGSRVATEEGINESWMVATDTGNIINFSHTPSAYQLTDFPLTNMKLTDNGSLLYVLYPKDLDVFDASHGVLRRRIAFAETAQSTLDSLAIDSTGQHAYAITGTGLLVITLDAVPLSAATLQPTSGSPGTLITVRGSGFNNQTTATLNGTSVPVVFVDDSTLTLTIPAGASGMQTLDLANPDGQTYTLEAAFKAN